MSSDTWTNPSGNEGVCAAGSVVSSADGISEEGPPGFEETSGVPANRVAADTGEADATETGEADPADVEATVSAEGD